MQAMIPLRNFETANPQLSVRKCRPRAGGARRVRASGRPGHVFCRGLGVGCTHVQTAHIYIIHSLPFGI